MPSVPRCLPAIRTSLDTKCNGKKKKNQNQKKSEFPGPCSKAITTCTALNDKNNHTPNLEQGVPEFHLKKTMSRRRKGLLQSQCAAKNMNRPTIVSKRREKIRRSTCDDSLFIPIRHQRFIECHERPDKLCGSINKNSYQNC